MSDYILKKDFPPFYLEEKDTEDLLDVFQTAFDTMYDEVTGFLEATDYERAEEKYLDLMLIESGWNLKIELDVDLKRKIIKIAQEMFNKKGLKQGIIDAILAITGLTCTITEILEQTFRIGKVVGGGGVSDYFGLDNATKKASAFLGSAGSILHFHVNTPTLTAGQLDTITKIVNFMKYSPTMYRIMQIL